MRRCRTLLLMMLVLVTPVRGEELLPRHVTPEALASVKRGLDYLARSQGPEGNWPASQDGVQYPVSMASLAGMAMLASGSTPSRGPYASNIAKTVQYVLSHAQKSGLICSPVEFEGRSMYGHGFAMLFLGTVHGMENDDRVRQRIAKTITAGIDLTSRGQSPLGGWTYTPGAGDEGSVTVTQVQGLRAAQNAGFTVPNATIERAIRYLELCRTPEGGIRYSYGSGPETRLPISAAAVATLYNAGEYDSPLAQACLDYVRREFDRQKNDFSKGGGHDYYAHLYAAQAFYQAGDDSWDDYFPTARDQIISQQDQTTGLWQGDGIGPIYGTSIALIVLQLPYKFLPIYQR